MEFDKLKERGTFYLIRIGVHRRSKHYPAETLTVGAYEAIKESAEEYKKEHPDAHLRITMAIEDLDFKEGE